MRSFFGRKFRAVVLTLVFSITVVPFATAAPRERDRDLPGLQDGFTRLVRLIKKTFAPSSNADSLTIPRP